MSDTEVLALVVIVVYLSDCAVWLPRDVLGFVRWWAPGFRSVTPGKLFGNDRKGLLVASLVPPLGDLHLASPWPFSIGCGGWYGFVATTIHPSGRSIWPARWHSFDQPLVLTRDRHRLLLGSEVFAEAVSAHHARHLQGLVETIAGLPRAQRDGALTAALQGTFDSSAVAARAWAYRTSIRELRILCNALFVYLFAIGPGLFALGLSRWWWLLLVGFLALLLAILLAFRRSFTALYPQARGAHLGPQAMMLVSPLMAIRAHDELGRDLFVDRHPLAVAHALCTAADFRDLARRTLADLEHPLEPVCPSDDPEVRDVEGEHRQRLHRAVLTFLDEVGTAADELRAAPTREGVDCRGYCPRCQIQYTRHDGDCMSCAGVALRQFEDIAEVG